jgi:hypothetical protein
LERLGGATQAEGYEGELSYAGWSGNGGLLYIVGMDGDLILCSHQVSLVEDGTTEKLVGVIMDMTDWVAVRDGSGIECSVVAARTPTVFLVHDV